MRSYLFSYLYIRATFTCNNVDFMAEIYTTCDTINYVRFHLKSFPERFPAPNISISSDGEVTWGHDVTITCSIPALLHQLLRGNFTLTKSSSLYRENHTSNASSAAFTILRVDFESEGLYQCCYHTQTLDQIFSSVPSEAVRLSVTGKQKKIH